MYYKFQNGIVDKEDIKKGCKLNQEESNNSGEEKPVNGDNNEGETTNENAEAAANDTSGEVEETEVSNIDKLTSEASNLKESLTKALEALTAVEELKKDTETNNEEHVCFDLIWLD